MEKDDINMIRMQTIKQKRKRQQYSTKQQQSGIYKAFLHDLNNVLQK